MTTCACNKPYYPNSTGEGPCHGQCSASGCDNLISNDDLSIWAQKNLCHDCYVTKMQDEPDFFNKHLDRFMEAISLHSHHDNRDEVDECMELLRSYKNN